MASARSQPPKPLKMSFHFSTSSFEITRYFRTYSPNGNHHSHLYAVHARTHICLAISVNNEKTLSLYDCFPFFPKRDMRRSACPRTCLFYIYYIMRREKGGKTARIAAVDVPQTTLYHTLRETKMKKIPMSLFHRNILTQKMKFIKRFYV
jgi:hypothetical protein